MSQKILLLLAVFCMAAYFRTLGLNWDEGAGLHPDERFLNMTQGSIAWGIPWSLYFDTAHSPMNPLNRGTNFYVYGTLPLFVVKGLMEVLRPMQIEGLHMIGRWVSVVCDLVTVLAVMIMAHSLRGFWAALVAAVLCASSVGLVQQAHFGTVDSMATCFATLTMVALLKASQAPPNRGGWFGWWCCWAGVFAGAAAATKAPSGLVLAWIAPAALIRARSFQALASGCAIAGLAAFLVFRVTHPYAFAGPGFWDLSLSERWLGNLQEQLRLGRPSLGYPPAVQWVDRSWLFSISNMFSWGVGELPTLLIATALTVGSFAAVRTKDWRYLMVATWGVTAFVYLALYSPNRYLRYQLPAYPMFFVVAGCFAVYLYRIASPRTRGVSLCALTASVLYSVVWCFAFTRIYTRETPRIEASRWIFNNVPAAVSLETFVNNAPALHPVALPAAVTLGTDTPMRTTVMVRTEIYAAGLRIDFLDQPLPAQSSLLISIPGVVSEVSSDPGSSRVNFPALVRFEPGRQYPLVITLRNAEAPLQLRRPRIAHETPWDDTVPLRIDGFDPFGGIYDGDTTLELFFRDTPEKIDKISSALGKSDYFFITSQRVWGSVGRLDRFYPMTQQFYRDLLGCASATEESLLDCFARTTPETAQERLGFELIKTFESYPTMGRWQIADEDADESFSVYDHPRVLLFRKTAQFSLTELQARLRRYLPDPRSLPRDP